MLKKLFDIPVDKNFKGKELESQGKVEGAKELDIQNVKERADRKSKLERFKKRLEDGQRKASQ
ncbi:hypothetical protein [Virgibacillus halodenitrificans]|uniref:hypothetical protein n=1 Tax=Virgibacillus halodenitrificans TaxID=1482 RepID=UPI001F3FE97C|nr:hypothetical protein [Virgibacillus halodenitrificans]